jgi:hypothetical protein
VLLWLAEVQSALSLIRLRQHTQRRRSLIMKWMNDIFDRFALCAFIIEFMSDSGLDSHAMRHTRDWLWHTDHALKRLSQDGFVIDHLISARPLPNVPQKQCHHLS